MEKTVILAETVFARALEIPSGAPREEFLAAQCGHDAALQTEVRSLLQAHEKAGGFLRVEPASQAETPKFPGYSIEGRLGQGALGTVYAAHDEKLNRPVAIKVLRFQADAHIRRRVLDEARQAAALADPAIVTIYSVLDESDPPAIVMERVEGFPLDRFAAELNFEQKARLLREVARGLSVAHKHGVLHRDLKPDNIIVGPDMRPRILDFGLAMPMAQAAKGVGGFEGTPLYASPEQARGEAMTEASDVFSLGSLMFKVLTGRPAYTGETAMQVLEAIATTPPPFLREVAVGVPEDLQAVCLSCLAWSPADRPTAGEVAVELNRFMVGEPVRLKPKLYDDLLRRSISEHSNQVFAWERQSIISSEERDSLEVVHRRLLADEDHWIIDARRITLLQTVLHGGTWLGVVATMLTVFMLRGSEKPLENLGPPWNWLLPAGFTLALLAAGHLARRRREPLAAATFLAGAVLTVAPSLLALLAESGLFSKTSIGTAITGQFTNQELLAASFTALLVSGFALWRLKMTGFAWTTAILGVSSYISGLLLCDWWRLPHRPEIMALWCLPLAAMEFAGLILERKGRVRWTLPFHLVGLIALVGCLDTMAWKGPTLNMLGLGLDRLPYFNETDNPDMSRLQAFSLVLNGLLFLLLMLSTEKSSSLDLRRAGKVMEFLALIHILTALLVNAEVHGEDQLPEQLASVRIDVALYICAALLFLVLAPMRSRWRMLVGGLTGCGLGSFLMVHLILKDNKKQFIIGLGLAGLAVALGTFAFMQYRQRVGRPAR
jgi:serine/threonine-protein kinase